MKRIRILTGVHAGAHMDLTPGIHSIGASELAKIVLSDWADADMYLLVDAHDPFGSCTLSAIPNPTGKQGEQRLILKDLKASRFAGLVLCVGDTNAPWPSDDVLLANMDATRDAKSKHVSPVISSKRLRKLPLAFALLLVGASGALVTTWPSLRAQPRESSAQLLSRVQNALSATHVNGINARVAGDAVTLTGMVDSRQDDETIRSSLKRITSARIGYKYEIASSVTLALEDALGIAGTSVHYAGNGKFVVSGQVDHLRDAQQALQRIRTDLNSNVKDIALDVTEAAHQGLNGPGFSELISTGDIRYAQTSDGVKHILNTQLGPSTDLALH